MLQTNIPSFYKARRDRLMSSHSGAAFFFPSTPSYIRNSDVHFPFRQESNFYYLTGYEEEHSFLVLAPAKDGGSKYRFILFVQPRDPEREIWDGERYGLEGAAKIFGADEVYPISEVEQRLPEFLKEADNLYYRMGLFPQEDQKVLASLESTRWSHGRSGKGLLAIQDSHQAVSEQRLFKSADELELLRKACQISGEAHISAMKATRPGMNEREVEALIDFGFRNLGCKRLGYGSIVAGGKNATCLHYHFNNEPLKEGDLLLIDAGGEYEYYTADITRTFPVGKNFSPAQKKVYNWVLKAQKEAIKAVKPGATLPSIHELVCEILVEGMLSLGLLGNATDASKNSVKEILRTKSYRQFYPHNTSHWLGMDVHDAGLYLKSGEPRILEPGMVLTIEPGLYVRPADRPGYQMAPEEFMHIGVRIEDDILVTAAGNENLTQATPREIDQIEALRF